MSTQAKKHLYTVEPTESFDRAVIALMDQFSAENPSIGAYRAKTLDGRSFTFNLQKKAAPEPRRKK